MGKKSIILRWALAVMVLVAGQGMAREVNVEQAQKMAQRFVESRSVGTLMAPQPALRLAHAEPSAVNAALTDYYVFNAVDGESFVVVAGDDRAEGVLGYGVGTLDMDNLPCGLEWLLGHYKQQMEWLFDHPSAAVQTPVNASVVVEPLLSCTWSQGAPYNDQCPVYKGQHCVTGCIATAMAQVMYYWQYPDVLPDLPAYVTGDIVVSALPGTTLNWDEMLDGYSLRYSDAQGEAVATLMRYCGQATRMGYGVDASGSGSWNQMSGITDFGYNAGSLKLHRDDYTAADWKSLMLEELTAHRPILYCGHGDAGGHAFVVDGYNGSKFSINWGWEGSGNGYFALDAFTVYGFYDFNYNQSMLVGVYPTHYTPPYDVEVDGICYRRHGNELTVVRMAEWDNTYSGRVVIPSHVHVDEFLDVDCVVTAIGNSAFKNCKTLRNVSLPYTLKRIGKYAFKGCTALTTLTPSYNVETIDYAAFQDCKSIREFQFSPSLKHISSYAFYGCKGFSQLNIPNTMKCIEPLAFYLSSNLTSLTIDMDSISDEAFNTCYGLKTITMGNHVKTIGEMAFADCLSLQEVKMGASVDSIAPLAFAGCTALTAIRKLPETPPLVADVNSFSEITYSRATLYVPESAWLDYYCCDVWTLFEDQVIEPPVLPGDANLDGAVNITDVNVVINDILSDRMSTDCDVNGDGSVNIADINFIIGIILGN